MSTFNFIRNASAIRLLHAAALFLSLTISCVPVVPALQLDATPFCITDEGSLVAKSSLVYNDHKEVAVADIAGQRCLLFNKTSSPGECSTMNQVRMQCQGGSSNCTMRDELADLWDKGVLRGAFTFYNGGEQIHKSVHVGIGAGVSAMWVERHCPEASVQAADLSASVVNALPYFGVVNTTRKQIYAMDGRKLVEAQEPNSVDIIFIDAMDDKYRVPSCLRTTEFFQTVYSKLVPGGVVVMHSVTINFESNEIIASLRAAAFPKDALHMATGHLYGNAFPTNHFHVATKPGGTHALQPEFLAFVQNATSGEGLHFVPIEKEVDPSLQGHDATSGCI